MKGLPRKDVGGVTQEGLMIRFSSAKRIEADGLGAEVHLASDQAVGPEGIRLERATEQAHGAGCRGASEENHDPFGPSLQVRLPRGREGTPRGSGVDACSGPLAVGADITAGAFLEGGERIVVEARPMAAWNPLS